MVLWTEFKVRVDMRGHRSDQLHVTKRLFLFIFVIILHREMMF